MITPDMSIYRNAQTTGQRIAGLSGALSGAIGGFARDYKQGKLEQLAMDQRKFDYEQAVAKAKRDEEERKRKEKQDEAFRAMYQTAQMESGTDQLTPEQMQSVYAQAYPEQYTQMQIKSALSRDPYAGRRLELQEAENKRKSSKDMATLSNFNKKMQLDYEKFYQTGEKNQEQIRQFNDQMAMRREEMELELSKPERERAFAQEGYRQQLPDYLQEKVKPNKIFVQSDLTKIKDANTSYSDIYKKVVDLQGLVPTANDFLSAKGTGETAGLVKSQVAQIITDYNRNIAELGALAGQDLTILEEAIPSPSQWKAMTYSTWKKTMKNLEKNIKEKYQGLMRNSDINVSGNILDDIAKQARFEDKSSYKKGSTASSVAEKYKKGSK